MKSWHPKLPTSAKARRMLYKPCGEALAITSANKMTIVLNMHDVDAAARFIIGTVAAELCSELARGLPNNWCRVAKQWRQWSYGMDWKL